MNSTFSDRHCIMRLGPSTGHAVTPIAFCRNEEVAEELVSAVNSFASLKSQTTALEGRVRELEASLSAITERYVELANSGDCGFWNPEEEQEVIAARAALQDGGSDG